MALVLLDRAKETTTVVGTGTATLLGAVTSYQSLAGVGNGNTTYYCIVDQVGANWEVGIGTYTAAGTTLARTTVLASSNAGALVVFTTGVKDVFVTYPSEKGVWYDASGNVLFTGTTTAANLAYTGTLTGSTGILNIGSGQVYKDASGNVGIGTSSPTSSAGYGTLTVNGTTGGQIAFNTAGTNKHAIYSSATDLGILNTVSGNIIFSTTNTERMRIDSSGNVGIGSSPAATNRLQVSSTGSTRLLVENTTNTVQLRIQTSTASALIQTDTNHPLTFAINNGSEVMRLDTSGNLLVGTTSAVANTRFTVERISGAGNQTAIGFASGGTAKWKIGNNNSDAFIVYNTSDTGVYLNSGSTSWTATSDERAKDIIEPIENAAIKVSSLRAVIGKYKTDQEGVRRSFLIAQDVQKVLPEAVNDGDGSGMLGLQYTDVIPLLTAAIQEQQAIITNLTTRLTALEAK